jgi:FkbM family methyltransferase
MARLSNPKIHGETGKRYDFDTKGIVECKIVYNSRNGYWVREDTFDRRMVNDSLNHYEGFTAVKGKTILDLGGNCGGFTKMAINAGASKVISLEPCPHNHQILCINAPEAINLNAAVTEGPSGKATFYYADSKRSSSSSSIHPRRNSSDLKITVEAYNINELLEKYRPDIVKMDIEGKEYDILDAMEVIPKYVKQFAIEFHSFSKVSMKYPDKYFPEDKWHREVKGFKFFGKMRHNDYLFRRK